MRRAVDERQPSLVEYAEVADDPSLSINVGDFSLDAWVKTTAAAGVQPLLDRRGGSPTRGWSLNLEGNNNWAFQIAGNSTTTIALNVPNITTGQWVHVAGVFDPTVPAMRLYLYGVLSGERTDVPTSHFNSPANAFIGRRENGTEFDGRLDEVRVFNRALTADEILALPEVVPSPVTLIARCLVPMSAIRLSPPLRA